MYSEKDLYVGKVLSVHQRTFELLEADEFTYQYMENNRHVYLMADWEAALKAIQAQLQGQPWPDPSLPESACDCWCEQLCSSRFRSFCLAHMRMWILVYMMLCIMLDTSAYVLHARNIHLHVQLCSPSAMPLECMACPLTTASLQCVHWLWPDRQIKS